MKIGVLENNLAKIAGRMQTMVAFADTFKQLGHDVTVYANFDSSEGHITRKEDLLNYHITNYLALDDFDFYINYDKLIEKDVVLIPFGGMSSLGSKIPVICWYIAQPSRWYPEYVKRIWTNSYTQKENLGLQDATVIYAPHDYSPFRKASKEWDEREIDILMVGGLVKSKEGKVVLNDEVEQANTLAQEYRVFGLFLAKDEMDYEVLDQVKFPYLLNVPRREVAKYMGNSKVLFHPSPLESCSLVIFEALNAGMFPIVREVGACREQMGEVGFIYRDFRYCFNNMNTGMINDVLESDYNPWVSIRQGERFDRKNTIGLIEEELKRFE